MYKFIFMAVVFNIFVDNHDVTSIIRITVSLVWYVINFIFCVVVIKTNISFYVHESQTKCASRRAVYVFGGRLIFMGILGKVAVLITLIRDCVLGGMTLFLFANVFTSGIGLLSCEDLTSRRNLFIVALSMAFGVGVTVWPYVFQDRRMMSYTAAFWTCADCDHFEKNIRNGVSIFLSTGYCIGTTTAMLLNLVIPEDVPVISKSLEEVSVEKPEKAEPEAPVEAEEAA